MFAYNTPAVSCCMIAVVSAVCLFQPAAAAAAAAVPHNVKCNMVMVVVMVMIMVMMPTTALLRFNGTL